ncbi:hypothetical protein HCH_01152 [Hahella chejuensis KCTC 2396]|uniref:Uncharacterized protein n=1 Tax=Hahella chejuensis (strain KCTC 2396) TaxID=349521 RepID=Q2SMU5_HAHCH|nr:CesT family type III secretion system chaperone [Hahella chejuensis]ABC28029.1 hypothetical protein HCH_01152 [Hahella chejuensis KCTC 2396]
MNPKQRINTLLKEFSQINDLPEFQLNEENVCGFQYVGDTVITLFLPDDQNQLVFLSDLVSLDELSSNALVKVLEYSFPGLRTKGAAISVNPKEHSLVLSFVQEIEGLTAILFSNILKNFIETAVHFRAVIADYQHEAPTGQAPAPAPKAPSPNHMHMIRG